MPEDPAGEPADTSNQTPRFRSPFLEPNHPEAHLYRHRFVVQPYEIGHTGTVNPMWIFRWAWASMLASCAEAYCERLCGEEGLTLIRPFDDPDVIAGQGTIGLELLEPLPDLRTVVVPLSGGGLLGGIALALEANDRSVRLACAAASGGRTATPSPSFGSSPPSSPETTSNRRPSYG